MPISSRVLAEDEEVLIDLRPHWLFLSGPAALMLAAVALAALVTIEAPKAPVWVAYVLATLIGVPLAWLALRALRWLGVSLVVTTNRLIYRRGVLGRDLIQLRMARVTEVHCRQRIWERVLGSGNLVVDVMGEIPFSVGDVRRARLVQRVIYEQLDLLHRAPAMAEAPGPNGLGDPSGPAPWSVILDPTPPHGTPAVGVIGPAEQGRLGPVAGSLHDQLVQLDDLRRRGILSDREFQAKKTDLLGRL